MLLALAQLDPTVGDLEGNVDLIKRSLNDAVAAGAHVVAFPELAISGYPPEDLLLKDHFMHDCEVALSEVAVWCPDVLAIVGVPLLMGSHGAANAAAVLWDGALRAVYRKIRLPNYAVFDEERYFEPGAEVLVVQSATGRIAVNVCEDIWLPCGPTEEGALSGGADLVVNISMSPYHRGKGLEREEMLQRRARDAGAFIAYVNGVGGQDELVFDGHSVVIGPDGTVRARGRQFAEELLLVEIDLDEARRTSGEVSPPGQWPVSVCDLGDAAAQSAASDHLGPAEHPPVAPPPGARPAVARPAVAARAGGPPASKNVVHDVLPPAAEVYEALVLGVRDYVNKNRFTHVVIGLSGGIDSALTACVAVDALGPAHVTGVTMPSRFSSAGTRTDAHHLATALGIDLLEFSIEPVFEAYLGTLATAFAGRPSDSAEENIQARIRGNLLMALSNKFGWLVLTTGNKSEVAVGYATLYGDMAGGFAVIKDVPKTLVYELSRYRNEVAAPERGPIPESTITRAPSAELRADQTDQDTLPPYDVLDQIIEAYVVRDESVQEVVARGIDRAVVERVVSMIDRNEYKRRQAAPGVRITPKAFGKDRRLPITNRYRG